MKLIELSCPHCGARLKVDSSNKQVSCEHCGAALLIDEEVQRVQYDNAEEVGYRFEKGRQRAQAEANGTESVLYQNNPSKKRRTWLWVLGWIFLFPLPLTIILLRKKMNPVIKYSIIAVAWIIYIFMAYPPKGSDNTKTLTTASTPKAVEETIESSEALEETIKLSEEEKEANGYDFMLKMKDDQCINH